MYVGALVEHPTRILAGSSKDPGRILSQDPGMLLCRIPQKKNYRILQKFKDPVQDPVRSYKILAGSLYFSL